MMTRLISDGRFFELTPFDWLVLLSGLVLSGLLTLLF